MIVRWVAVITRIRHFLVPILDLTFSINPWPQRGRVQGCFGPPLAGCLRTGCQCSCLRGGRTSSGDAVEALAEAGAGAKDFRAPAQIAGLVTFFYLPYHAPFAKRTR